LLPLVLEQDWIEALKASLPELPDTKRARFIQSYGLTPYDASVLVAEKATSEFFEIVAKGRDPKIAANWITGDFFAAMNRLGRSIEDPPVTAAELGGLLDLIGDNTINGRIAKDVFEAMVATGKDAAAIVDEKGLRQVTDTAAIDAAVDRILAANPDKVAEYRSGKDKLFGFFVGQTMKAMAGKGNPGLINETLKRRLAGQNE
jgi:aspartyl-tRNA(Asn)/glutamyl-tRNA(Gln) amidotransferase subunit B